MLTDTSIINATDTSIIHKRNESKLELLNTNEEEKANGDINNDRIEVIKFNTMNLANTELLTKTATAPITP